MIRKFNTGEISQNTRVKSEFKSNTVVEIEWGAIIERDKTWTEKTFTVNFGDYGKYNITLKLMVETLGIELGMKDGMYQYAVSGSNQHIKSEFKMYNGQFGPGSSYDEIIENAKDPFRPVYFLNMIGDGEKIQRVSTGVNELFIPTVLTHARFTYTP